MPASEEQRNALKIIRTVASRGEWFTSKDVRGALKEAGFATHTCPALRLVGLLTKEIRGGKVRYRETNTQESPRPDSELEKCLRMYPGILSVHRSTMTLADVADVTLALTETPDMALKKALEYMISMAKRYAQVVRNTVDMAPEIQAAILVGMLTKPHILAGVNEED